MEIKFTVMLMINSDRNNEFLRKFNLCISKDEKKRELNFK